MASTVLPNGIIIPEKYSRDWYNDLYHNWQELDNLLAGGGANDGTLTIQKNGTTVGTFSANQATDKTINISVPTATSELTNDSGFITEDNTKIPLAGSSQISGDLIPSTDGTVNLGSVSYQWNNAYIKSLTINGVACGDILTHNVSEFVDVANTQTIPGTKTFSSLRTYFGRDVCCYSTVKYGKNSNPASTSYQYLVFSGNIASEGSTNQWDAGYIEQVVNTNGSSRGRWRIQDTAENYVGFELWVDGNDKQVRPMNQNATILGEPNRRWKDCYTNAINGINPDELGLPTSTYTDVSSYITHFDSTANTFTAPVSGLLNIVTNYTGDISCSVFDDTTGIQVGYRDTSGQVRILLPLKQGDTITVYMSESGLVYARIYHLKGKV